MDGEAPRWRPYPHRQEARRRGRRGGACRRPPERCRSGGRKRRSPLSPAGGPAFARRFSRHCGQGAGGAAGKIGNRGEGRAASHLTSAERCSSPGERGSLRPFIAWGIYMRVSHLIVLSIAASTLTLSCAKPAETDAQLATRAGAPLFEGMGAYHRVIDTNDPGAQRYFDQGMMLAFGFNHAEAIRSFRAAQKLDPSCAMCFWGEALAT